MDGYANTILYVDLTKGSVTKKPFPAELKKNYLGGRGLGVKLVSDLMSASTDALDEKSVMVIATGPLTDGRVGQVAFLRLQEVPWTVMMSIPVAEIPTDRPVQWFALLGLLLGLAALGITLSVSRRILALHWYVLHKEKALSCFSMKHITSEILDFPLPPGGGGQGRGK